ncbi:MAG: hypothetical protein ACFFCW_22845 [Candidatus Hodarchaeota archaeon]
MRSREILMETFNKSPKPEGVIQNQKLMLEVLIDIRDFMEIMERKQTLMQKTLRDHFPPDTGEKVFETTIRQIQQKRYSQQGRVSSINPPPALKGVEIKPHSTSQKEPFEPL